jgi:hypothetical protein
MSASPAKADIGRISRPVRLVSQADIVFLRQPTDRRNPRLGQKPKYVEAQEYCRDPHYYPNLFPSCHAAESTANLPNKRSPGEGPGLLGSGGAGRLRAARQSVRIQKTRFETAVCLSQILGIAEGVAVAGLLSGKGMTRLPLDVVKGTHLVQRDHKGLQEMRRREAEVGIPIGLALSLAIFDLFTKATAIFARKLDHLAHEK